MDPLLVMIDPEPTRIRMRVTDAARPVLRAVLGPLEGAHPRAAATLLEGLALWHQRPLTVVLCADDAPASSALALYDALGGDAPCLHYAVGVAYHPRGPSRGRLDRRGDVRDRRLVPAGRGGGR